jgi:hypothetical protein
VGLNGAGRRRHECCQQGSSAYARRPDVLAYSFDGQCITEPIDKSERVDRVRLQAIGDLIRNRTVYKITRTSESEIETQITAAFLELPFDMKQVVAWTVFSLHFDGADEPDGGLHRQQNAQTSGRFRRVPWTHAALAGAVNQG